MMGDHHPGVLLLIKKVPRLWVPAKHWFCLLGIVFENYLSLLSIASGGRGDYASRVRMSELVFIRVSRCVYMLLLCQVRFSRRIVERSHDRKQQVVLVLENAASNYGDSKHEKYGVDATCFPVYRYDMRRNLCNVLMYLKD